MVTCFLFSIGSFYGGLFVGWYTGHNMLHSENESENITHLRPMKESEDERIATLQSQLKDAKSQISELKRQIQESGTSDKSSPHNSDIFSKQHTGKFASGLHFVDRDDFAAAFDTGVPLDETTKENDQVVVLYSDPKAFPKEKSGVLSVEEATANCLEMHVVLTHTRQQQCIAIMGQYESYHIQKYMRLTGERGDKIDKNLPLKYVARGLQQNGRPSSKIPTIDAQKENWNTLISYLVSLDKALEDLEPLLETVASHNDNNAIIVMVCNFGQSELLLNCTSFMAFFCSLFILFRFLTCLFVSFYFLIAAVICNARAKGLESVLSNIFLFATDQATHELAQSMGISSIYIESIFGKMPEKAAGSYADKTFRAIMLAKVYCIQMVSMLGYDILFQDVDVIWYQNPLTWFHDESNPHYDFDMYFQDDGNHALFYAPYSANTGFYYVRNNERTQYFFNSFLMAGDKILGSGSHQIPLIAHLSEQASIHGLRVKIWERTKKEFPGGFTFHKPALKGFMKELMSDDKDGTKDTYIFHMSWTKSKVNKIKFYQQMGQWYLQDTCIQKPASEIPKDCCAASPMVTCHYRDKPSKIPCKDSDPIDKNGRSWW